MKNRKPLLDSARATRLSLRDEDPREITKIFGKSFKPYAKAANRKARRSTRSILREVY